MPTGRAGARGRPPLPRIAAVSPDRWQLGDSRSVRSVWVWRAFFLLSLVAVGVVIIFATNGKTGYAAAWGVIAAGWFAIAMWLWSQHNKLDQ
jgi:hypothetical protein